MALYCPPKNSKEFREMVTVLGSPMTHYIWNDNEGYPIEQTFTGQPSQLFKDLLAKFWGDRAKAIETKAIIYRQTYKSYNNWKEKGAEPTLEELFPFDEKSKLPFAKKKDYPDAINDLMKAFAEKKSYVAFNENERSLVLLRRPGSRMTDVAANAFLYRTAKELNEKLELFGHKFDIFYVQNNKIVVKNLTPFQKNLLLEKEKENITVGDLLKQDKEAVNTSIQKKKERKEQFFKDKTTTTVGEALDVIINDKDLPTYYHVLAKKLKSYGDQNMPIKYVSGLQNAISKEEKDISKGIVKGLFIRNRQRIAVSSFFTAKTILHEILHAVSHKAIAEKTKTVDDFEKLYQRAKEFYGPNYSYALKNLDEFLVGIFTDENLIKTLQQIEPITLSKQYKNLFEEIIGWVLNLIKMSPKDTFYSQAFSVASNIIDEQEFMQYGWDELDDNYENLFSYGLNETQENNEIKPGVSELFESNPELLTSLANVLGLTEVFQGRKTEKEAREFNYYTLNKKEALQYGPILESVFVDKSKYLHKYEFKNGKISYTKEFDKLLDEFKELEGESFDILDNSKEGLTIQNNFFKFLKEKGFKGYTEIIDGYNQDENTYIVTFDEHQDLSNKIKTLYSQYIDTIFPDSKVKDIVYRGGNLGTKQPQDVEAFTTNKSYAEYRAEQNNTKVFPAVLNIKESKLLDKKETRTLSLDRDEFQYQDYGFTNNKDQTKQLGNFYTVKEINRHILGSKQDIEGFKDFIQDKKFQKLTSEEKAKTIEQVTKEHRSITALKDLAAKLAHRIGGKVEFQNHSNADWKGYNQGMKSVLNEAYMTPDTPFHEILAHPIIRAIKNRNKGFVTKGDLVVDKNGNEFKVKYVNEDYDFVLENGNTVSSNDYSLSPKSKTSQLYQSLLKELETGRGKEVFEQVKRDYNLKINKNDIARELNSLRFIGHTKIENLNSIDGDVIEDTQYREAKLVNDRIYIYFKEVGKYALPRVEIYEAPLYTLEEQQEEAIVTLLGMMAADKLDAKKDATLISKLKELWKQISDFVKSLLKQDGIKIDELPITTTLNDLAEIMAYGNNKIILPGYKIEYSTPLGNKYDTLEEINNEIRGLADAGVEVDLSGINIYNSKITKDNLPKDFVKTFGIASGSSVFLADNKYNDEFNEKNRLLREKYKDKFVVAPKDKYGLYLDQYNENQVFYSTKEEAEEKALDLSIEEYNKNNQLSGFIEKNKEYEQSKEIIEQWKKENNIQYDPEEVYSRGQGFYSSIGAYSNLELDLLLKNLIQHIQDNKKAGGEFTISAFTKPINKRLKHIEGTGDRVRFVIYPKSNHIKWAAPTDVFSGSVWDASEKVSKDKKSELLGVSFTKAPALRNINEISPNLADIIDNLSHAHNELGIELTTNNFRIEYDDNIDYSTKKLIDNINKILDDKYGKLVNPEIKLTNQKSVFLVYDEYGDDALNDIRIATFGTFEEAQKFADLKNSDEGYNDSYGGRYKVVKEKAGGKQPTQTKENTTSIESVKSEIVSPKLNNWHIIPGPEGQDMNWVVEYMLDDSGDIDFFDTEQEARDFIKSLQNKKVEEKEYTQQAETNLKIAALKEVARKYPRSLITSKVVLINPNVVDNSELQYSKVSGATDEYGNTWNEIVLDNTRDTEKILFNLRDFKPVNKEYTEDKIKEELISFGIVEEKGKKLVLSSSLQNFNDFNADLTQRIGLQVDMPILDVKNNNEVVINKELLSDDLEEVITKPFDNKLNKANVQSVEEHFSKIFPNVKYKWVKESDLDKMFPNATQEEKDKITAFVTKDGIVFVEGRMTPDSLTEEFMHVFVEDLRKNNPILYNHLLEQAKNDPKFAALLAKVERIYAVPYNNDKKRIEAEFLTQAIATTFTNQTPLTAFERAVKRFKEWICNMLYKLGINNKAINISNIDYQSIEQLARILEYSNIYSDISTEQSLEGTWFNMKEKANEEVKEMLESKGFETLRSKYKELFTEGKKTIANIINREFSKEDGAKVSATLKNLLQALENKSNVSNIEAVTENIMTYYAGISRVVRVLDETLATYKEARVKDLHLIAYKAVLAATTIEKELGDFVAETKNITRKGNPLLKEVDEAIKAVNNIKYFYKTESMDPITEQIWNNSLRIPYERLKEKTEKEIDSLEKEMAKETKDSKRWNILNNKKKELKKMIEDKIPSLENFRKQFMVSKDFQDIGVIPSWTLAAISSSNMTVQAIAADIHNVIEEGKNNASEIAFKIWELQQQLKADFPEYTTENFQDFFKQFTETKTIHYVDGETNEIVKDKEYVTLIGEMDDYALNNDVLVFDQIISSPTSTEEQIEKAKKDKKELLDKYAERRYTKEYYDIYNTLSEGAREYQKKLYEELSALQETKEFSRDLTEEDEEKLIDLQFQIDRIDSDYDRWGNLKEEPLLTYAKEFKEYRALKRDAKVGEFKITAQNKELWDLKKQQIDEDYAKNKITKRERDEWYEHNVKSDTSDEFKKEKEGAFRTIRVINNRLQVKELAVKKQLEDKLEQLKADEILDNTDEIEDVEKELEILNKAIESRKSKKDLFAQISDLVKGYKDENGVVKGNDIPDNIAKRIRDLEYDIEELKDNINKVSGLSKEESQELYKLKGQLYFLTNKNSPEAKAIKFEIKQLLDKASKLMLSESDLDAISEAFGILNEISDDVNTEYYVQRAKTEREKFLAIPGNTEEMYEQSTWFQNNHIWKTVYSKNADGRTVSMDMYVPSFIWRKAVPKREEDIVKEAPTSKWFTYKIKKEFVNPNYQTIDGKYKARKEDITGTEPDKYKNKKWETLSPKQKKFLENYTKIYLEQQELVSKGQRMGLKLPGILKGWKDNGFINALQEGFGLALHKLKTMFLGTRDFVTGKKNTTGEGEEENEDYAIQTNRNFLKMKYQGRVDKDKISYNLLDSLASYAVEANIYKQLQQNASRLLGAKNLLEQNKGATNMSKQVSSYIDMIYYNEYDKGGATVKNRMFNKIINSMRGSSAFFMLAAKPINDLKNIMSGVTFGMLYSNNRWYTKWDYFSSLSTTKEILLSHFKDKLSQGNKTDLGMKIQYFNIIQGDLRDQMSKGFMNSVAKGIFSTDFFFKGRELTELIIQYSLADAISKNYKIPVNGVPTPILNAYKTQNGMLKPIDGAYKDAEGNDTHTPEQIKATENQYKMIVKQFNINANGNFSKINRTQIEQNVYGRLLVFMQRYFPTFFAERFRNRGYNNLLGEENRGTYMQLYGMAIDLFRHNTSFSLKNYTEDSKYRARIALDEHIVFFIGWALSAILRGLADGDDDDDLKGKLEWNLLHLITQVNNEVNTFNPLDFAKDYVPFIRDGNVNAIGNRMITRRFTGNLYSMSKIYIPILRDSYYWATDDPKARFSGKGHGMHEKGSLRIMADLQKLVPYAKGLYGDIIAHPKDAVDAYTYFNGR